MHYGSDRDLRLKTNAFDRHETLHDLGLIPALERIEDLIAAGRLNAASQALAEFIRPAGHPRLNLHKPVAPLKAAAE